MSKSKTKAGKQAPKSDEIRLSQHPRAQYEIRRAKGWGGLIGCALAAYLEWKGGLPFFDIAMRALLWGVVAYVVVWFVAVQVWRQLAIAEIRAAEKAWQDRKAELERLARERAAMAGQS